MKRLIKTRIGRIFLSICTGLLLGYAYVKNFVIIQPIYVGKEYNFWENPENKNLFNVFGVPVILCIATYILITLITLITKRNYCEVKKMQQFLLIIFLASMISCSKTHTKETLNACESGIPYDTDDPVITRYRQLYCEIAHDKKNSNYTIGKLDSLAIEAVIAEIKNKDESLAYCAPLFKLITFGTLIGT